MATKLTKPQASYLLEAMSQPMGRYAETFRVVGALLAKGLVEEAGTSKLSHATLFKPTVAGLEALAEWWALKDAASGCLAYRELREAVDAALAAAKAISA